MTTVLEEIRADFADLGFQPPSDEERARLVRRYEAEETATVCGDCGKAIAPVEPIHRVRRYIGHGPLGGARHNVYPVCEDCAGAPNWHSRLTDCEACGRPMYQVWPFSGRHQFCCLKCATKIYRQIAKDRKAVARRRTCPVCEQEFSPARNDAKTCSSVCRQKAYRQRVTDRAVAPGGPHRDKRNSGRRRPCLSTRPRACAARPFLLPDLGGLARAHKRSPVRNGEVNR